MTLKEQAARWAAPRPEPMPAAEQVAAWRFWNELLRKALAE